MNAIKVSDSSPAASVEPIKRSAPPVAAQSLSSQAAASPPVADRVSVTQESAIKDAKAAAAEARLARIGQLEQQIQAGTFKPDPQGIASKMLRSAQISAQIQSLFS